MAKKRQPGDVNKSQAIRDAFAENPDFEVKEIIAFLGQKGIVVAPNLVYFTKGKMKGAKGRGRKIRQKAAGIALTSGDPVATILKVKKFADEVGGLKKLKALVEALSH